MAQEPIVVAWSGGKDSALALREVLRSGLYRVIALVTTCTEGYDRISMHGVRCALLAAQAESLGLPLVKVFIPQRCDNAEYEKRMKEVIFAFKSDGVSKVVFGDLFLEDIRAYRDRMLAEVGMTALYPLWGRDTTELASEFIDAGFEAMLVCVDPRKLEASFAGRRFDRQLLDDLPAGVDPCGENGEFHTFVSFGLIFQRPVECRQGPVVTREGFIFADLLPVAADFVSTQPYLHRMP